MLIRSITQAQYDFNTVHNIDLTRAISPRPRARVYKSLAGVL